MKKLSKIIESIWSDMQDRGTGDAIKIEDDFTKDEKDSLVRLYLIGYIKSCVFTYKNPYDFSLDLFELHFDDYWERDHRYSYQLDGEDKEAKKKKDWSYFTRNWDKGDDLQKKAEDKINEYEERISRMGLKRKPSYSLIDTLNYWWRSLDDNQKKLCLLRASEFVYTLDQDELDELDEWAKQKLDLKWGSFSYDTKLYAYDCYTNWSDKVDESIWSDMQDRGTEDSIKKEDDTFAHFASELKKKYEFKRPDDIETGDDYITIPMFKYITYYSNLEMQRIVSGKKIIVFSYRNLAGTGLAKNEQDAYDDLLKALDERFDTKTELTIQDRWFEKYIRPKDGGEIDNKFFIEVLDFIIDTLDKLPTRYERIVYKLVKESIWSDMQDRGTGDIVKKEDDVNNLDIDGLDEYILDHYSIDDGNIFYKDAYGTCIGLSIFYLKLENDDLLLEYFFNDYYNKMVVTTYRGIEKYFPDMFYKMKKEYRIYDTETPNGMMKLYGISPKDGREVDNKFFLEILDFIIDNFERINPKIRKIIDKK